MSRAHAYPPDLAQYVLAHWPEDVPLWLSSQQLSDALSQAYQASLTQEEGRPTRFRLLLTPIDALPEVGRTNRGALRLRFDRSRALNADELRRLSPAVPFETALIGAHVEDDKLRIWGIAHSGPAWLAPTWGGRSVVPIWTSDPIVHVTAPGRLTVRRAGKVVAALVRGEVVDALVDVFESEWLARVFVRERELVQAEHATAQAGSASPTMAEQSLIGRVSQHMLRRMIQLIRGERHGGMVLLVDRTALGGGLPASLRLKYPFTQDEPSHRYRTLLFEILDSLATRSAKATVGWLDFAEDASQTLEQLEQAVFEWSRVIANLSAVDGAVALDKRFGVLGFGAEVSAEAPAPSCVSRALDTEGTACVSESVENVGTRHRAAYRFVTDHPQGLAIVVSHDGGVSFVANRDGEVVFWEQNIGP
jgi:hypothetical protein